VDGQKTEAARYDVSLGDSGELQRGGGSAGELKSGVEDCTCFNFIRDTGKRKGPEQKGGCDRGLVENRGKKTQRMPGQLSGESRNAKERICGEEGRKKIYAGEGGRTRW